LITGDVRQCRSLGDCRRCLLKVACWIRLLFSEMASSVLINNSLVLAVVRDWDMGGGLPRYGKLACDFHLKN
jgi:hypothetical protein